MKKERGFRTDPWRMLEFIAARQESQPLIPMRQIELKPSVRNSTNPIVTQIY